MNEKKGMQSARNKILVVLCAAAIAIGIGLGIYNSPENRLNRQVDLGQKYLEEAQYEEAIVVFNQAIEIEPMSSEAYLGLAEAHIGLGNWESAMEVLQKGYEMTGEEALQERKQQLENEYAERRVSELEAVMVEKDEDIQYMDYVWSGHALGIGRRLTVEQLKEISEPYIELLKEYVNYRMVKPTHYHNVLRDLIEYYVACGEYDICLSLRKQLYEETGFEYDSTKERTEIQSGDILRVYDKYGREVYSEWIGDDYVVRKERRYNDSGLLEEEKHYGDGAFYIGELGGVLDSFMEYTYDEEKRLIGSTWKSCFQDTGALNIYRTCEYDYHDSGFTEHCYSEIYDIKTGDIEYIDE